MPYRVRSAEGEVVVPDTEALRAAWSAGLVEPDDEVREEPQGEWRRAGSLPVLTTARLASPPRTLGRSGLAWLILAVCVGLVALYAIGARAYALGFILTLADVGILFHITRVAFRLRRR